ncbi:zinc dependent phospholipase C family protein [Paratissierella segnis]|jgi:phospholipase C|uniref:Phospholipase C n=1 Tax=Paratissierella segnis TaxID=2763679 RepID=A0A926EST2_9FIRM|nr:zinc dependent phospholipase C family protein [Paratissierella segnis]MBC8587870.1 zinc dependent phospholipase C family protein [Paratissierella segnis]
MGKFETTYDGFLKLSFSAMNPIKKVIINTHCKVHIFINAHAIIILKTDKYLPQYRFFNNYLNDINEGSVWADQDFKSSNHFYNPYKKRGMYGRKSAMDLGVEYYNNASDLWNKGKFNESMFYLGASLHIIQDMTVPQHANIRLLNNHRQYENFIKQTYSLMEEYNVKNGAYLLTSIEDYIEFNARVAIRIYKKFKNIKDDSTRFYKIARCGISLAERTTAGAMVMFYKDVINENLN